MTCQITSAAPAADAVVSTLYAEMEAAYASDLEIDGVRAVNLEDGFFETPAQTVVGVALKARHLDAVVEDLEVDGWIRQKINVIRRDLDRLIAS